MLLGEFVRAACQKLENLAVSDTPRLDVELITCNVLGCERSYLFAYPEKPLSNQQIDELNAMIDRRLNAEPVAYILSQREFWSLPFYVDDRVLIPRPDTEVLVERVLSLPLPDTASVVDLGTGSGAIAVVLASERPNWRCYAVDFSEAALQVARTNAQTLLSNSNLLFWRGSWLDACKTGKVDLVVANPPYIDANDQHLSQGDVCFEPQSALVSGAEGLSDIAMIAGQAVEALRPGGYLVVEHGWQQQSQVVALLESFAEYRNIECGQDYGGQPRYVAAVRA